MENSIQNASDTKHPLPPSILKHFLVAGISPSTLPKDKRQLPVILSSFTMEQNKSELARLINLVNHDTNTINNIFPIKSDYINSLTLDANDSPQVDVNLYEKEYILPSCREPFFHSFIYKFWGDEIFEWYFTCFVFWEEIESKPLSAKKGSLYAAKAFIIITKDPYFSLCKKILKHIYMISTRRNQQVQFDPIEPFILNLFNQLRTHNNTDLDVKIDDLINYHIKREQFFPVCDMNLFLFFQLFSLADVLFLAEQFFSKRTIVVVSSNLCCLYPIYHILMTLIHPLDLTDNSYLYKLLTPNIVNIVFNDFPLFLFIYADKIDNCTIETIARRRPFTTVITVSDKNLLKKMTIKKRFYQLEANTGRLIAGNSFPQTSIINEVIDATNSDTVCQMIKSSIKKLQANKKKTFYYSGNYIEIRQLFFGLMCKFFVSIMPAMTFHVAPTKKEQLLVIECVNTKPAGKFLKEFINTPTFDIVKKVSLDIGHPNLKDFILFDELIKITLLDPERVYFDFKTFEKNQQKDEDDIEDYCSLDKSFLMTLLVIDSGKMYDSNTMAYLSQLNKHLLRGHGESAGKGLRIVKNGSHFVTKSNQMLFNFGLFDKLIPLQLNEMCPKEHILLYEIDAFHKLLRYRCLPQLTQKVLAGGACGLCLSLLVINNLINTASFQDGFSMLFNLFQYTTGFDKMFNFLISFLYEIMLSNDKCYAASFAKFFDSLIAFEILPTVTIVLKFKHKLKAIIDNNNSGGLCFDYKGNKAMYRGVNLKITSQKIVCANCKVAYKELEKEYKCFICKKPFKLQTTFSSNRVIEQDVSPPLTILTRMLKQILQNQSLLILDMNSFYEGWLNDVLTIAFLMNTHFFSIAEKDR